MTYEKFTQWLRSANSGSRVEYHYGNLAFDRQNQSDVQFAEFNRIADAAWAAHKAGRVALVQRRIGAGICVYEATRT